MTDNNSSNSAVTSEDRKKDSAHDRSFMAKAWDKVMASRRFFYAAGGVVLAGAVSIHYFNNETDLVERIYKDDEINILEIDEDTNLITKGDSATLVYKGVSCPLIFDWPKDVELTLGNTGDASLSPDETGAIETVLGSLGVTRDLSVTEKPTENASELMKDFYDYARDCNNLIASMRNGEPLNLSPIENTPSP